MPSRYAWWKSNTVSTPSRSMDFLTRLFVDFSFLGRMFFDDAECLFFAESKKS